MLKKVHHINLLVRDLDAAVQQYRTAFSLDNIEYGELSARGVRTARFRAGETWFHTLQGEQTPTIWNFLFNAPGAFAQNFSKSSRDAYDTLNLRVGLEAENWSVTAWGRNITDEEYLQEVIPTPEFGGSFNHQSGLRSYGVDFSYRF